MRILPVLRLALWASVVTLALLTSASYVGAGFFAPAGLLILVALASDRRAPRAVQSWLWTASFGLTALGLIRVNLDEAPSIEHLALLLLGALTATARNRYAGLLIGLMASGGLVYVTLEQELLGPNDPRLFALGVLLATAGFAAGLAQEESDQTELLREQLADLGEHLKNVLACVGSGVLVVDREGRVATFNRAAERILGVQEHTVIGRELEASALEPMAELFRVRNDSEEGERRDLLFPSPLGNDVRVGYAMTPLEDRAGRRLGTILVFQDVTLIRDYEERMLRQEKLAALGRLVSGIAHEFGNQLGGVRGLVDLALLDEPEEAVAVLPTIRQTLTQSLETVEHLLRFARGTPLDPVPGVQLGEVVQRALGLLRAQVDAAGAEIELVLEEEAPTVSADTGRLEQVFLNILINGLHATSDCDPPRLRIEVTHDEAEVVVRFEDNGPGVSPEVRARIFEPFFTTKGALGGSEVPGTGLGLAMALGVVEGHQGKLTVGVSPSLGGACFSVHLPSAPAERDASP